jgi:Peptidase family M1 domain
MKHKITLLGILFTLISLGISAQKPYFQQTVNTKMAVTLDDKQHRLTGNIDIEYINNSPESLSEIWMHLWANAYKNRRTALAKQFLRNENGKFYFSSDSLLGGFKGLDFLVNGQKVTWNFDAKNPDIAVIKLNQPLPKGGKITISTPLNLKIPYTVSRLGHVGDSYQMTQWFPKPAVFDNRGWHAMPYLNQGEFYSEFGNYDVSITLPENYVVGATGTLQTASELEFMQKKEAETLEKLKNNDFKDLSDPFPTSAATQKTIRYTAENVHDFAWFADKRFMVTKEIAVLKNNEKVDCYALFTNSNAQFWHKAAKYVRRSVEYYSERVGAYPWPHATAVHSALSAGGGMEYPMITVVNSERSDLGLDDVITHEVGHNWFYGILASNERDHPYLDEGFNSYYEFDYTQKYYNKGSFDLLPSSILNKKDGNLTSLSYATIAADHYDIPPDTHSEKFTSACYGTIVYVKTALAMKHLEESMGTAKFDKMMQSYYTKWKFKHPYPEDFEAILVENGVFVDWYKDYIHTNNKFDAALTKATKTGLGYELTVKNKGKIIAPYPIAAIKNDSIIAEKWYQGYQNSTKIDFQTTEKIDYFVLDNQQVTLDINRKNNTRRPGFLGGIERPKFKLIAPFASPRRNVIGILPWLAWNDYDKLMAGVLLYNPPFPTRKFQYYIAPGLGTGSNQLVGFFDLKYKIFTKGFVKKITLGLNGKSANFDYNFNDKYYSKYTRLVPSINFDLKSGTNTFKHSINLRTLLIGTEFANYDSTGYKGNEVGNSRIYEAVYKGEKSTLPNPFNFSVGLEYQNYKDVFEREGNYLLTRLEWKQKFFYKEKKKVTARFFAGIHLKNTGKERKSLGFSNPQDFVRGSLSLSQNAYTDYKYDQQFLGRSAESGLLARQINESEGGFKYGFGAQNAANVGHSNAYILACNLKADLPQRLPLGIPLKPWFDIGYAKNLHRAAGGDPLTTKDQLFWSGGFMLEFLKGHLNIYFPLVNSKNIRNNYCSTSGGTGGNGIFCGGNYLKWISWSFNLDGLEPHKFLDDNVK